MKHIGIKEARQHLRELIEQVEHGESVVITRQGQMVAQLIPPQKPPKTLPSLAEFRNRIGSDGTPATRLLRAERDAR